MISSTRVVLQMQTGFKDARAFLRLYARVPLHTRAVMLHLKYHSLFRDQ